MDRSESEIERLVFNRFEELLTTSDLMCLPKIG